MKKTKIVLSLGGSLVVPKGVNAKFLKDFHALVLKHAGKKQFFVIVGGGRTAREYQASARQMTGLTRDDLDWLGIHSSRLNAHLIRTLFRKVAHPRVLNTPGLKESVKESVVVAGGWKPGWSTDYVAVQIAKSYGAKEVINLSNVETLFDKDPKKHKGAKPIYRINWKDFRKIVGNRWDPGLNLPFDPVASKLAQKLKMKVVLMGGDLKNFEKYLRGESFKGTVVY